jgi:Sulfotransferase domain
MAAAQVTTFQRRMPPLAMRIAMGLVMYGIGAPIIRTLDRFGRAPRMLARGAARRSQKLKASNPLNHYTSTHHDVFVAAHVKSGTNWMMQIAHQLLFHGDGEYDHIHSVVPWPDIAHMSPLKHYAIPIDDPSVWRASPEQKRVIKTHYDWDWLPYSPEARYIIVIRDPKDVFVSSYHFFVKQGPLAFTKFSVETWLDVFLSTGMGAWSSWPQNTAGYWAERARPNVLIVSFKTMKQDLRGTVKKVAAFLDVHAGDDIIDRVCEKSSFDYMKRIDHKFRAWDMVPWASTAAPMMRKGGTAGSSELLSLQQQQRIDQQSLADLRKLGSDFPYEEFCDLSLEISARAS